MANDTDIITRTFWVDIPILDDEEWVNVAEFATRQEAIDYAKERFGADDEGKVILISG